MALPCSFLPQTLSRCQYSQWGSQHPAVIHPSSPYILASGPADGAVQPASCYFLSRIHEKADTEREDLISRKGSNWEWCSRNPQNRILYNYYWKGMWTIILVLGICCMVGSFEASRPYGFVFLIWKDVRYWICLQKADLLAIIKELERKCCTVWLIMHQNTSAGKSALSIQHHLYRYVLEERWATGGPNIFLIILAPEQLCGH